MRPAADLSKPCQLLDDYPLSRSRSACEASQLIGRALSPHQLHVRNRADHFEARHNQIHLGQVALNVLSCGAEVEIDPGERGDYYLLQLPLQGRARVSCNGQEAWVGTDTMSVLQPRAQTRMVWTSDCAMIMVQIPSQMLRNEGDADSPLPALRLTRSSHDPAVAAWWQAMTDMTRNLRSHGDTNRLQRALDHIHANIHAPHGLAAIAAAACMSPRALEAAFRRRFDLPPLAYARAVRLEAVHRVLQLAARNGHPTLLSDAALQHGFIHMGRFAAYYEQRFGCSPSVTLRGHAQH